MFLALSSAVCNQDDFFNIGTLVVFQIISEFVQGNMIYTQQLVKPDKYCVPIFLAVNEYDAHLSFMCVKLN